MSTNTASIIAGVDTHKDTHHAAVLDAAGRLLASREFHTDRSSHRLMLAWMKSFGDLIGVGVEGTGSYGAGLTRELRSAEVEVFEVNRPDRSTRRRRGKSDPIDAESAARAVLSGQASGTPKDTSGAIEAIRVLRVARSGAVKARTAALNQLKDLIVTAPEDLRSQLNGMSPRRAARLCARMRPDASAFTDPTQATKAAMKALATRIDTLDQEIALADRRLTALVAAA